MRPRFAFFFRWAWALAWTSALWMGGRQTGVAQTSVPERPNVVLIVADDLGWSDLSVYGNAFHETPNLDRLAAEGIRFTSGYAAAPVCSPTRASLLTGRYPAALHLTEHLHGPQAPQPWQRVIPPEQARHLPLETSTLAERLSQAGYATAHMGKWHLGGDGSLPEDHGFDVNIAGSGRGLPPSYFYPYVEKGGARDLFGEAADSARAGEYLTNGLTDEAIGFVEAHQDTAFFLHLAYYTVHVPVEGEPERVARYEEKKASNPDFAQANPPYAAMVESLDENVGRLLGALDRLDLSRRTLIAFLSDNGGLHVRSIPGFDAHTPATTNAPLRAGKGYLYEGGLRVPFMARWPEAIPEGVVSATSVSTIDVMPTVLDLLGLPMTDVDGISLLPLLTGAAPLERAALYWHFPHYSPQGGRPASAVREGSFKLIEFLEDGRLELLELYDLAEDIGETRNLAEAQPERAARLRAKLSDWRQRVEGQMPTPNPQYDPEAARRHAAQTQDRPR